MLGNCLTKIYFQNKSEGFWSFGVSVFLKCLFLRIYIALRSGSLFIVGINQCLPPTRLISIAPNSFGRSKH